MTACGSGTSDPRQVPVGPTAPSRFRRRLGTRHAVDACARLPCQRRAALDVAADADGAELTSSQQSGSRTYEFQVSDRTDFSLGASLTASFLVAVNQTGVAEGSDGRTAFTVPSELQPTTRMYWRARAVQGTSTSSWSEPATFRTKLVGYSRPGELYDPLIHSRVDRQRSGCAHVDSRKGPAARDGKVLRAVSAGRGHCRAGNSPWKSKGCIRTVPITS